MNGGAFTKKQIIILALGVSVFVLLIVFVSLIIMNVTKENPNVSMANEETVKKEGVIDDQDLDFVKTQVRDLSKFLYALDDDQEIEVSVRESTYKEEPYGKDGKYISVVVDVDTTKASYRAEFEHHSAKTKRVVFSCLPASESKYPEAFCYGTEGHSSIDSTLSDMLPYRKIVNGVEYYKVDKDNTAVRLLIQVQATCDDDAARENAKAEVKKMVGEYGLDPEQVPISIDPTTCKAYEDSLRGHGTHHM